MIIIDNIHSIKNYRSNTTGLKFAIMLAAFLSLSACQGSSSNSTLANNSGDIITQPTRSYYELATGLYASNMASENDDLYWTEETESQTAIRIVRASLISGATSTVLSGVHRDGSYGTTAKFKLKNGEIYLADFDSLRKVSVSDGTSVTLASMATGTYIYDVTVDDTYVYWLVKDGTSAYSRGKLLRMPISGGIVEAIAGGFVCDNVGHRNDSMFYDRYIYCADSSAGTISRIFIDTGVISIVATGIGYLSEWTTDGTNVYYSNQDTGGVYKVSVNGGAITTMSTTNGWDITKLASDGQFLYWINQTTLARTPINGGTTEYILIGNVGGAYEIMVDEYNIYWSYNDLTSGGIVLTSK